MHLVKKLYAVTDEQYCDLSFVNFYSETLVFGVKKPVTHRQFRINTLAATLMETHPYYEENKIDVKPIVAHMLHGIDIVWLFESFEKAIL